MDNTPSVVYGLEYQVCQHRFAAKHARRLLASSPFSQTRALSAVAGETDAVQFLVDIKNQLENPHRMLLGL